MGLKYIFLFTIIIAFVSTEYLSYKNYKVYKIVPKSEAEVKLVRSYENEGFDFWTGGVEKGKEVRVMVAPNKQIGLEDRLKNEGVDFEVLIHDVQELVTDTLRRPSPNRLNSEYSWDFYQNLDEINEWLETTANNYPDVATVVTMGTSFQGRNITGLKIDFRRQENATIGFFEGGIHAREWITPATMTWIINEFLTSSDPAIRSLAENVVWHFFPVTNPDGYEYSFTDRRLWRKNRNTNHNTTCGHVNVEDDLSNGVDLNRNFGFYWNTVGASDDPCSQVFAGEEANSEPETRAIINYVENLQAEGNLVYYISFHSFTQLILLPYSHTAGADVLQVSNYADLHEIAIRTATRLQQRYNTTYTIGTARDILYAASGGSIDWAKGGADIPIVLLYEFRDLGRYGFLLPPEQIIPNSEEVMDSLIEMDRVTRQMGYYTASGEGVKINVILLFAMILYVFYNN